MTNSTWEGFAESWNDFVARIDHHERLLEYLDENLETLQLLNVQSVLSVGPGSGELDHGFLRLLPMINCYTAVEPDEKLMALIKINLKAIDAKKTFVTGNMEDFPRPDKPHDVVLLAHVAYYFGDTFDDRIRQALSWLNQDGTIVLVVCQNRLNEVVERGFHLNWGSQSRISAEDVRERLLDMTVSFKEIPVHYTLDLTHPGKGYYDFVSVLLNRKATEKEVDRAIHLIGTICEPGTKHVDIIQYVFIIKKTENK